MKLNQNNHNLQKDFNLVIQNIDTTSERLTSDNIPGRFFINSLTEKCLLNPYQEQLNINNTENRFQKYSDNIISKTMRNTQKNYSSIKDFSSSQKETKEMTCKKSTINRRKNTNKKFSIEKDSKNYQNIIRKINMISSEKTKKVNYKNKIPLDPKKNISKITNSDNKDSYLYLQKLKKNYSMDKLKYEISTYTNIQSNNKKGKKPNKNDRNIKNNITTNNFYNPTEKFNSKKLSNSSNNITDINFNNKSNKLDGNFSNFYNINFSNFIINQNNNNDYSEIFNARKKFNATYNYFYKDNNKKGNNNKLIRNLTENINLKKINIKKIKLNNGFDAYKTSDYSSINSYWNKRNQDTTKKIAKIKNELFEKEKNEIQLVPKISKKSKELAINSDKYNFEFNNIYDRLFYINNLNLNLNIDKDNNIENNKQNEPLINEKSKKMTRTIDDLYLWKNKKEKKLKENTENLFKKIVYNKKNINQTSEAILKERRPNYLLKKVEDRLLEQGKNLQIKKEMKKEKSFNELKEKKIFVNNNYSNIKSKYLEKNDNSQNINDNNKSNENIQYNFINIANTRNYDNFNKKLIYYGPNLNLNSFNYYSNKLNNSNKNKKTPFYSKSMDKNSLKSFDDNFYINNSIIDNYLSYIKESKIYNNNQITYTVNSRIPKDLNDISRPKTYKKNDNSNMKLNIENKSNINNITNQIINLNNNLSFHKNITDNKINNNNEHKNNASYYSLLYNDMINYNSKRINNIISKKEDYNNKINKIEDLKLNLNINNNEDEKNKIKAIYYNDSNKNTGKFNTNEYPIINNILNLNDIKNKENTNLIDNINLDSEIINLKSNNQNNKNNYNRNINNEIINQITSSISSLNNSKVERRDKRKEDLMKIIKFSNNLYNSIKSKELK